MASTPPRSKLHVTLINACEYAPAYETIRVSVPGAGRAYLDIQFQRLSRVPDVDQAEALPVPLGFAPIYPVDKCGGGFASHIVANGGVFIPMKEGEYIQITFDGPHDFALKIFAGGVNAVSGKAPSPDDTASRIKWYEGQDNLQDYVVTKLQERLEGIVSGCGKVIQLSSSSLEFSADDSMSSLQFEVMPVKAVKFPIRIIRAPTKKKSLPYIEYKHVRPSLTTANAIKSILQGEDRIPVGHQIIKFNAKELLEDDCLIHCGVRRDKFFEGSSRDKDFVGDYLFMYRKDPVPNYADEQRVKKQTKRRAIRAGEYAAPVILKQKRPVETFEMGSPSGGLIRQTIVKDPIALGHWDKQKTVFFNVHFLHPSSVDRLPTAPEIPEAPEVFETPRSLWSTCWSICLSIGWSIVEKLTSLSLFKSRGESESEDEEGLENEEGEEVDNDGELSKNQPVVTLNGPTLKRPFLMISELQAQLNLAWMSDLSLSYPEDSCKKRIDD
ncbi:hypothetical protein BDZ45DRAFT_782935 [Acephala macrosclerotiorum]|nr:hypothetical protein BDZ45DRAFT_782935 [Acephala macrosclerotiorum]